MNTGAPSSRACECPAGSGGACSHILSALRLLILLKKKGFREAPPELACTELPQQWRRPRQQGVKPASVQSVDWRSPREGGLDLPTPVRLFDARKNLDEEQRQVAQAQALGSELGRLKNKLFAPVLLVAQAPFVKTKTGMAPTGSPMWYHQFDKPHGFKTWLSTTVAPGRGAVYAVPELQLFDGAVEHTFPDGFMPEEHRILAVSLATIL